jgi:hypothetical protein
MLGNDLMACKLTQALEKQRRCGRELLMLVEAEVATAGGVSKIQADQDQFQ